MHSPLPLLHNHVINLITADTRSPISADGTVFDFVMPFPGTPDFKECDLMLQVEVEWYEPDVLSLEVQLRRIKRNSWKNPKRFFGELLSDVELFLHSCYDPGDGQEGSYMPEGWLYPRVTGHRQYVIPAFSLALPFEAADDVQHLYDTFNSHLLYSCGAMWLAAPIFAFVAEHKREPNAWERMRLLSIAHGTIQVLRPEGERQKGAPPPDIFFPQGFYSTRYCGDAIRQLRPQ